MERGYRDNRVIKRNGVRLGDQLEIIPMQGRTKRVHLNRTCYHFERGEEFSCKIRGFTIEIPSTREVDFKLILCPETLGKEGDRYLLKAKGEWPFRLNGSYSYESFIERGDQVDLGYNRFIFREKSLVKEEEFLVNGKLVQSELSIMIEGETGTGKSRLAALIHQKSGRLGRFVHINLSSFSLNLIESELFGHVKGAFTGAVNGKRGAILDADKGTLFLDEIDSLPLEIQTKILLFLDSKEVRLVGGSSSTRSDVRLIFASGQNLAQLVAEKKIRKDLFYRLKAGASFTLKPLRETPQRIEDLCYEYALSHEVTIAKELIDFYKGLNWEGNIRELLGHLEKKRVMVAGKRLVYGPLDEALLLGDTIIPKSMGEILTIEGLKRNYAKRVFNQLGGNFSHSARALGVTVNTVRRLVSNL